MPAVESTGKTRKVKNIKLPAGEVNGTLYGTNGQAEGYGKLVDAEGKEYLGYFKNSKLTKEFIQHSMGLNINDTKNRFLGMDTTIIGKVDLPTGQWKGTLLFMSQKPKANKSHSIYAARLEEGSLLEALDWEPETNQWIKTKSSHLTWLLNRAKINPGEQPLAKITDETMGVANLIYQNRLTKLFNK